ncbi:MULTISPECIES: PepSY domain-containing protein [Sphingomonadaceae]|jgi:uncharacterized iron-regulated membrane protein|uniref:PepSY domain-containing protein n=1 Tax=Sphingobium olei TaxID=420955 RepID=A0ABW3NZK1_9SPHN|nr:PepSY domain-containing protein [Sphingomonas sp. S-NIH.Pt1_0416]RSU64031.1 hypothetical protein BRX36_14860 [Sphingomonas sp. S-NIH.Pt1_0416]
MNSYTHTQRKGLRISPLLFRRIHKWVGLILGLQFVLWTLSGSVMALLDMDKVGGHGGSAGAAAPLSWPANPAPLPLNGPVESLTARQVAGTPVLEVVQGGTTRLFNAATGQPVAIDNELAVEVARAAYHQKAEVKSVSVLQKANLESRDHKGPMYRIDFADEENSSAYVSAVTGRPLVSRGDTWRLWDFAWMLHNMDYVNRSSFNHPLIIFVGFGTLWLSLTGFYLLFKSFRRREFNWVLGKPRS